MKINRVNDLSAKEWLKFQKSWFVHNPPPRTKDVLMHPAKFPETMVREFIEFFTKKGEMVLDPMVGTGSTLLACIASRRNGIGIELLPKYADVARRLCQGELSKITLFDDMLDIRVITDDAINVEKLDLPPVDYCITSPPYWNMLRMKGAETQRNRREKGLDVSYSEYARDLGNITDYQTFLDNLCSIYEKLHSILRHRAYFTIIVKNVKKGGRIYPLAWDIGKKLSRIYTLKDEKIWCQDNQRIAPYGLGNAWVSNTFHHYCLNFRKE